CRARHADERACRADSRRPLARHARLRTRAPDAGGGHSSRALLDHAGAQGRQLLGNTERFARGRRGRRRRRHHETRKRREIVIELIEIGKRYPRPAGGEPIDALIDVSLSVERGEFVAITGASGSGKSTLMNVFGLLDEPTVGRYTFDGDDVTRLAAR